MLISRKQYSWYSTGCGVIIVLELLFLGVSGQPSICPVGSASCSYYGYDSQYIYNMICGGWGPLNVMPPTCSSNPIQSRIVDDLTINPNGTTISTIQSGVLSGLRVRSLVLSNLGIESIDPNSFDLIAADLESLLLNGNQLTNLPASLFLRLSKLTTLRLDNNKLSYLPTGVFSTLTSLQTLTLDHNQLTSIPTDAFSSLSKLTVLTLGNNKLASLSTAVFTRLSSVASLTLNNNELTTLPATVFSDLSSLVSLTLTGNQLTTIKSTIFGNLSKLSSLELAGNRIESVESGLWSLMPSLKVLDIGNNSLSGPIDMTFVSSLRSLQDLRLNGNSFSELSVEALASLGALQRLNISRNNLTQLSSNLFLNNTRLLEVDMSFNAINFLAADVFKGTFSMTRLFLNDNQLPALPIYGTGNYLFKDMSSLKVLHLQNNRITGLLKNALAGLTLVTELNLSNNNISSLPLGIFDPLGFVETLSLADNQISNVELKPFVSMRSLVTLNARNNRITAVTSDWFITTSRLSTLILGGNLISTIDTAAFHNLTSLVELDLSENQLSKVDGLFNNCNLLRSINLARNPLRNLANITGSTFAGLTSLVRLNLSSTCLTNVSFEHAANLNGLQELDLSSNGFSILTAGMFSALPNLQRLNMAGNNIFKIETSAFWSLTNLITLNMSMNILNSDSQLTSVLSSMSSSPVVDLTWNFISSADFIPVVRGGVYLRGNPITCTCPSASSIASSDFRLLADSADVACLFGQQTAVNLLCYWTQCNSNSIPSLVGVRCPTVVSGDTSYLFPGQVRQPSVCPWDPSRPQRGLIIGYEVIVSPTGVVVKWNTTSLSVRVAVFHQYTQNVTDLTGDLINGTVYTNQSEAAVNNLVAGQQYNVCIQVVTSLGAAGDYSCKTVTLPVPLETTGVFTTAVAMATTTANYLQPLTISLSTTATDNSVRVMWSITSGIASSVAQFRITWTVQTGNDLGTKWIQNDGVVREYVITNLTAMTSYLVCIQAIAADTNHVTINKTECQLIRTTTTISVSDESTISTLESVTSSEIVYTQSVISGSEVSGASSSNIIIIIAACVAGFVLLLLVLLIVICLVCRRRRNQRVVEARPNVKEVAADGSSRSTTTKVQASESLKSTHSLNIDRLAEHGTVSIDIYEDIPTDSQNMAPSP